MLWKKKWSKQINSSYVFIVKESLIRWRECRDMNGVMGRKAWNRLGEEHSRQSGQQCSDSEAWACLGSVVRREVRKLAEGPYPQGAVGPCRDFRYCWVKWKARECCGLSWVLIDSFWLLCGERLCVMVTAGRPARGQRRNLNKRT